MADLHDSLRDNLRIRLDSHLDADGIMDDVDALIAAVRADERAKYEALASKWERENPRDGMYDYEGNAWRSAAAELRALHQQGGQP